MLRMSRFLALAGADQKVRRRRQSSRASHGWMTLLASLLLLAMPAWSSATFGHVVPIGGAPSDLALDEARGVLYVANFTANRIELLSTSTGTLQSSLNVAAQPSAVTLSPDGRWLVVTHYGNMDQGSQQNGVTVIDLDHSNARQTFALASPPLGAAFGIDNKALIVTTTDIMLFDPMVGTTQVLTSIADQATQSIPAPVNSFPANIVQASVAASPDGAYVWGLADSLVFRYNVATHSIVSSAYTASPTMGPRAVSAASGGGYAALGYVIADVQGIEIRFRSEFAAPQGDLVRGSHAVDGARNLVYSQVPSQKSDPPTLKVLDAFNLTVLETLRLQEDLAGPSVLSSDGSMMYSSSVSGVTILPVGHRDQSPRVVMSTESLVFEGNFCERDASSQTFTISDPGGANVPFSVFSDQPGVSVSPSSGSTPAVITVTVDPNSFAGVNGTVEVTLSVVAETAVNVPDTVRVLVNNREPDQRGTFIDIPGKLVDLLAHPDRDEYYVLRQDKNQLMIFNGTNHTLKATLKTCTQPMGMAITFSHNFLLVGCNLSELVTVIDLQTYRLSDPIVTYNQRVQSLAASSRKILAVVREAGGGPTTIQSLDMAMRRSSDLGRLGVWENQVEDDSVATAAPNGSTVLFAGSSGGVWLYDANIDDFTVSRSAGESLSGAYAASSYGTYVIGNKLYNSSLVPTAVISPTNGTPSGFAFVGQNGYFLSAPGPQSNGVIERVNASTGVGTLPTRTVEAPLTGTTDHAFTRTIAPLASGSAIVTLTTSGVTILPPSYDAAVSSPEILRVVSAADGVSTPAPGGLFSVYGNHLSATNIATSQVPLPTALAGACLTVNGFPVPMIYVSDTQVNAQMPFQTEGATTMTMHSPAGVSNNFNLVVNTNAPSVFQADVAGPGTAYPTIVRLENNLMVTASNPVHRSDVLVIYLTGLGAVSPAVGTGDPTPLSPLSETTTPPTVTIGGQGQDILFSGLVPGQVGLYQINVQVKYDAPTGLSQPLVITQGDGTSSVNVRVVD